MIRIDKPKLAPEILRKKGKKKTQENCKAYTQDSKLYDSGKKKFDFDSSIYGHETVKAALIKAQHDKCCFCESKVTHISYGDVEHFRPKAGVRQTSGAPLEKPGYYWLAYEWSNLFFSCQLCNQYYKENLFPLENPKDRARTHKDSIEAERPVLISPDENTEEFLSFRVEVIYAIENNLRGRTTIQTLGLNRELLAEERKKYYEQMKLLYKIASYDPPTPESKEAENLIKKSIQNSSKYTLMMRGAIKAKFQTFGS